MNKFTLKRHSELTEEEKEFCRDLFFTFYKREYSNQDPKNFEFKLEEIDQWLESQFQEKVGDSWLLSPKGFLSFTVPTDTELHLNIFQLVIDSEESKKITGSISFLKELGRIHPKRAFRSAIRKSQKDQAMLYKGMGCKVQEEVNLPGFSSEHYLGVEMPSQLVKALSFLSPGSK